MGRLASRVIWIGLLSLASCEGDEAELVYPGCVCVSPGCSAQACGFDLGIHANCVGQFDFAELDIGGHLEDVILIPGKPGITPCTRVEPAQSTKITVRGGTWVWQVTHTCDPASELVKTLVFECQELQNIIGR
jgi:hypothetical protein